VKVRHRKEALRAHVRLGGTLELLASEASGAVITEPFQLHVGMLVEDRQRGFFRFVGAGILRGGGPTYKHQKWSWLLESARAELYRRLLGVSKRRVPRIPQGGWLGGGRIW